MPSGTCTLLGAHSKGTLKVQWKRTSHIPVLLVSRLSLPKMTEQLILLGKKLFAFLQAQMMALPWSHGHGCSIPLGCNEPVLVLHETQYFVSSIVWAEWVLCPWWLSIEMNNLWFQLHPRLRCDMTCPLFYLRVLHAHGIQAGRHAGKALIHIKTILKINQTATSFPEPLGPCSKTCVGNHLKGEPTLPVSQTRSLSLNRKRGCVYSHSFIPAQQNYVPCQHDQTEAPCRPLDHVGWKSRKDHTCSVIEGHSHDRTCISFYMKLLFTHQGL